MKKNIFFKYLLLALAGVVVLASCRKVPDADKSSSDFNPLNLSFIGVPQGSNIKFFFEPFSDVKSVKVFTVKKDAANNADLNIPEVVTLTALPGALTKYNADHGTSVELLPSAFYTIGNTEVTEGDNGDLTADFKAGDFAKDFIMKIDGSKLDLSKTYAVAYKISETGGLTIHAASQDTIYAFFSVKNKWDGVYSVDKGSLVDKTTTTLTHINDYLSSDKNDTGVEGPMQYELRTISPTECEVYDNHFFGGYYIPIKSGDGYSQYGSFSLIVKFDPETNKIVSVTNHYGQPAANGRKAELDPSGANTYDPASKSIDIHYNIVGGPGVGANDVRANFEETWVYIGARQ